MGLSALPRRKGLYGSSNLGSGHLMYGIIGNSSACSSCGASLLSVFRPQRPPRGAAFGGRSRTVTSISARRFFTLSHHLFPGAPIYPSKTTTFYDILHIAKRRTYANFFTLLFFPAEYPAPQQSLVTLCDLPPRERRTVFTEILRNFQPPIVPTIPIILCSFV